MASIPDFNWQQDAGFRAFLQNMQASGGMPNMASMLGGNGGNMGMGGVGPSATPQMPNFSPLSMLGSQMPSFTTQPSQQQNPFGNMAMPNFNNMVPPSSKGKMAQNLQPPTNFSANITTTQLIILLQLWLWWWIIQQFLTGSTTSRLILRRTPWAVASADTSRKNFWYFIILGFWCLFVVGLFVWTYYYDTNFYSNSAAGVAGLLG